MYKSTTEQYQKVIGDTWADFQHESRMTPLVWFWDFNGDNTENNITERIPLEAWLVGWLGFMSYQPL